MSGIADLIAVSGVMARNVESEECPHAAFPEVSENESAKGAVVGLISSLAEIAYTPGISDDELGRAAEHALILAMAVGMALGKVAASESLEFEFVIPDDFEGSDWS